RVGSGVGAELLHRQVESVGQRAVGGGGPRPRTWVGRTVDRGLAYRRDRLLVDGLLAGYRVDRLDHVLVDSLLGPQPSTVAPVDRLDDAELADCDDGRYRLAVDLEINQDLFVGVVEVPGVGRQPLVIPDEFPGIGPESQSRIGV